MIFIVSILSIEKIKIKMIFYYQKVTLKLASDMEIIADQNGRADFENPSVFGPLEHFKIRQGKT